MGMDQDLDAAMERAINYDMAAAHAEKTADLFRAAAPIMAALIAKDGLDETVGLLESQASRAAEAARYLFDACDNEAANL